MNSKKLIDQIQENIDVVIAKEGAVGKSLWKELLETHPVDIAHLFKKLDFEHVKLLYNQLPKQIKHEVFQKLTDPLKAYILSFLSDQEQIEAFQTLSADEVTDLFDIFSDEELKKYLDSLHKKVREKIIAMLKFAPESAGGIMHTDVLTLFEDFTVEKSVQLLQRLRPSRDIHRRVFVISKVHRLVGYINLEDLLLHKAKDRISSFMNKNEVVVHAKEDQEKVARKMIKYDLMTVPVIDDDNIFLGVISGDTLADILIEEAAEDVHKMAALAPIKRPYFEAPFFRLLYERGYILVALLLAESFSTSIMHHYHATLTEMLLFFVPMLISVGGNTSNQTSAVAIQGMATGEFNTANMIKFLRREFAMASFLALILGVTSFARVYYTTGVMWDSSVVSLSLTIIVMVSVVLGSAIPFVLKRFNIDPAFSAGPFLATLMDILGIFIYCTSVKMLLF